MTLADWIGTTGVTLLLIAFALNISKKISASSKLYLLLNILGAGLAGVSSYLIQFWPFVVLESVWVIATLLALFKPASDEKK
ncbi:MAG: CBU_0592 family membrane protein [Bacteroidia bacterium]